MDCTLKMHERFDEVCNLETGKDRAERLDQHFDEYLNAEMADMRLQLRAIHSQSRAPPIEPNVQSPMNWHRARRSCVSHLLLDTLRDTALADHVGRSAIYSTGRVAERPYATRQPVEGANDAGGSSGGTRLPR